MVECQVTHRRGVARFVRVVALLIPLALIGLGVWSVVLGYHGGIGLVVALAGLAWIVLKLVRRRRARLAAAA